MRYGKVLGIADPDTNIHSNNLYLEILVGSGIVGLAAFFILLARISWRDTVLRLPLGVALLHGVFDFFLMTTPLYFAFWILVGEGSQAAKESD